MSPPNNIHIIHESSKINEYKYLERENASYSHDNNSVPK